jgi:hypothetical protein
LSRSRYKAYRCCLSPNTGSTGRVCLYAYINLYTPVCICWMRVRFLPLYKPPPPSQLHNMGWSFANDLSLCIIIRGNNNISCYLKNSRKLRERGDSVICVIWTQCIVCCIYKGCSVTSESVTPLLLSRHTRPRRICLSLWRLHAEIQCLTIIPCAFERVCWGNISVTHPWMFITEHPSPTAQL